MESEKVQSSAAASSASEARKEKRWKILGIIYFTIVAIGIIYHVILGL